MALSTTDKKKIYDYIITQDPHNQIVTIKPNKDFSGGEISYSDKIKSSKEVKTLDKLQEEWVTAYLVVKLITELHYTIDCIELEKQYDVGKDGKTVKRNDVVVYDKRNITNKKTFLFIECKQPDVYEKDKKSITGQLFNLAAMESNISQVKYLVYYTLDVSSEEIKDNAMIIDFDIYKTYESFLNDNENSLQIIPPNYGQAKKLKYISGDKEFDLDTTKNSLFFSQLRTEIHDTLWGGSTDYNSIFSNLIKLLLAKIHDELNTEEGEAYEFQIAEWDGKPETPKQVFEKINKLYKKAQRLSLYQTEDIVNNSPGINKEKINEQKIYFVVQKLQGVSFLKNIHIGSSDILGDFFEGIISKGFKQDKGTFFTHPNIVRFMIEVLEIEDLALFTISKRLEMPFIVDPSCGSGTFLIEVMKYLTKKIQGENKDYPNVKKTEKVKQRLASWFPEYSPNVWAKEFIYGVDSDVDLTLATKVNMVLHGDGNINVFNRDGLGDFTEYDKLTEDGTVQISQLSKKYEGGKIKNWDNYELNEHFDIIITNPPFSIKVTEQEQKERNGRFFYNHKKNSENLFVERWYQLLQPKGRLGVVLPESVFDTTENKYIRLFIYRYFNIKAIVSLPQVTFEPFTSTKCSLLFAQKKTKEEVWRWENEWASAEKKYSSLRNSEAVQFVLGNDVLLNQLKKLITELELEIYFTQNIIDCNLFTEAIKNEIVTAKPKLDNKSSWLKTEKNSKIDKFDKFIAQISEIAKKDVAANLADTQKEVLKDFLRHHFAQQATTVKEIIEMGYDEITEIASLNYPDQDGKQPYTNGWWVFSIVAEILSTDIVFASAENVGYKRKKNSENIMPNDLFQTNEKGELQVDTKNPKTILDFIKQIKGLWLK